MDRHSIHRLVSVNAQSLIHSAAHLNGLIQFHVNVSVVIDQTNVHIQIKYSMKNCANVNAQRYLSAPVGRDLINKHVNASVLSQDHSALILRNLMTLHASVSAQIAQQDVPILRFSITINANAAVPKSLDVQVGKDLIQTHANVNALDQSLHVLTLKNLITLHANVSARIDRIDAPTPKFSITVLANVAVLISSDALVGKNSIQTLANVSVLNQGQSALMLRNLMM